jgi:hypothetical protein
MKISFGKYRGRCLEDLPNDYLDWLSTRFLQEPLKSAVEAECRRRAGTNRDDFSQDFEFRLTGDDRTIARRIVENGRRALAKNSHPDAGGDPAVMTRINVVADAMLEGLG